jgi:TonB family protein
MFAFGLCNAQAANEWSGFYPESYAREVATTKAIPIYPPDAIRRGIGGVVQAKIAFDDLGEVTKIKIHPDVDPALKQAVADAVSKWTFIPRPEHVISGLYRLTRLTFKFSINGAEPQVELYDPGPAPKDRDHLGYWNGAIERDHWRNWEEVKPTKIEAAPK